MKITVFCGANNGKNEAYKENAKELGKSGLPIIITH